MRLHAISMSLAAAIAITLGTASSARAQACNSVTAQINALVSGETLNVFDNVCIVGNATLADGATLYVGGLQMDAQSSLTTYGNLVVYGDNLINGQVTINGPAGGLAMQLNADTTWATTALMTNNSGIVSYASFTTATDFRNNADFVSNGSLVVSGIFSNSSSGYLGVRGDFAMVGAFDNAGSLEFDGHRNYTIERGSNSSTAISGVMTLESTSQVYVRSGTTLTVVNTQDTAFFGGALTNEGTVVNGRLGTMGGSRWINAQNSSITNAGTLYINDLSNDGQITNTGLMQVGGLYTLSTASTINGTLTNSGVLYFSGGTVSGTGSYVQTGGEFHGGNDSLPIDLTLGVIDVQAGSFCLLGTVRSTAQPLHMDPGVTLCPGASPGSMTIDSDLTFDRATLEIQIAGTAAGSFDVLTVNGHAVFNGGTVKFIFLDGFLPQLGDSWSFLVLNGPVTGLASLGTIFEGLPPGYDFQVVFGANGATVSVDGVSAVPEPATLALLSAGLLLLGFVKRARG